MRWCPWCLGLISLLGIFGCRQPEPLQVPFLSRGPQPGAPLAPAQFVPNPLQVRVTDSEFFWNQLVDTIDDYFSIRSERRADFAGGVPIEGLIETHDQPGATVLEPWLWDSSTRFEVTQSTLQSIRRRARVQVIPVGASSYGVNVEVYKELEDVDVPIQGMPGSFTPRHDGSLIQRIEIAKLEGARTLGWIPIGRDTALEQEILRELYGRLVDSGS